MSFLNRRAPQVPRLSTASLVVAPTAIGVSVQRLNRPYAAHWHDFHELFLVTGGCGVHFRNGREELVSRGSLGVVTPLDVHGFQPAADTTLDIVNVVIGVETLSERPASGRTVVLDANVMDTVRNDLDRLGSEVSGWCPGWQVAAHATLQRIMVDAARVGAVASRELPLVQTSVTEIGLVPAVVPLSPPIRAALTILEREFAGPLSLIELAERVHLSPAYLSDRFHREVGQRFAGYRRHLRLRFAAALLAQTDLPVGVVRARSGHLNTAHFCRIFRREFGCSPSDYRSRRRADGSAPASLLPSQF
ncbi:AraC family transcriptional regulator [Actinoplanes sp. NPDC049118]|uniref:AraC family transcriptional regulator n=1 Tax=Actinoplanes sp. NPDC049118 TaxID=3155769 RepID=UPI0033ECDD93